jgi:Glycosyltransferase family 87
MRENALCTFLAAGGAATMAWLGLYGFAWNDYDTEARAAVTALVNGHLLEFLRLAPAYGGSLLERAPFALLSRLWGGGDLAIYRMISLPCLLAGAVLGVWLVARMRSEGRSTLARALTLGICVVNPVTLSAIELGHPEELLGASLCVAAVMLAARPSPGHRRTILAGVILGLAIANKEWALLAVGPVLLALPAKRRLAFLVSAGATATVILAPLVLFSSGGFVAGTRALAAPPSTIFQPWQLLWFLGHHGALVHGAFGAPKPGFRIAPGWTGTVSHPLILAVGVAMTAALWLRRRRRLTEGEALIALALLLLMRCMLDTWDVVYYPLPFIVALLAWEVRAGPMRPPMLALGSTALVWVNFHWMQLHASADVEAAFFLAWVLPLAAWLAIRVYWPGRPAVRPSSADERRGVAQETTASALGRLLSTS